MEQMTEAKKWLWISRIIFWTIYAIGFTLITKYTSGWVAGGVFLVLLAYGVEQAATEEYNNAVSRSL